MSKSNSIAASDSCLKRRSRGFESLVGKRYGRLVVLELIARTAPGKFLYKCKCDCGSEHSATAHGLRAGDTKSCGCLHREKMSENGKRKTTHGLSDSVEWRIWRGIRLRCLQQDHAAYHNYGGRGITICERWMKFENFLADVGKRPGKEYTIDRIDNSKGYEPGNVRWATSDEQHRNRRDNVILTFNGKSMCVQDWANQVGMSSATLRYRLCEGWSVEDALSTPVNKNLSRSKK